MNRIRARVKGIAASTLKLYVMGGLGVYVGWLVFFGPTLIRMGKGELVRNPAFFVLPAIVGGVVGLLFPLFRVWLRRLIPPLHNVFIHAWLFLGLCFFLLVVVNQCVKGWSGGFTVMLGMVARVGIKRWLRVGGASMIGGFMMYLLGRILMFDQSEAAETQDEYEDEEWEEREEDESESVSASEPSAEPNEQAAALAPGDAATARGQAEDTGSVLPSDKPGDA